MCSRTWNLPFENVEHKVSTYFLPTTLPKSKTKRYIIYPLIWIVLAGANACDNAFLTYKCYYEQGEKDVSIKCPPETLTSSSVFDVFWDAHTKSRKSLMYYLLRSCNAMSTITYCFCDDVDVPNDIGMKPLCWVNTKSCLIIILTF